MDILKFPWKNGYAVDLLWECGIGCAGEIFSEAGLDMNIKCLCSMLVHLFDWHAIRKIGIMYIISNVIYMQQDVHNEFRSKISSKVRAAVKHILVETVALKIRNEIIRKIKSWHLSNVDKNFLIERLILIKKRLYLYQKYYKICAIKINEISYRMSSFQWNSKTRQNCKVQNTN